MPGIFGVVDLEPRSPDSAAERLQIARRMAAAMCYESAYVSDIVSSSRLSACAGRVGRPLDPTADSSLSESARTVLLTTGEPIVSGEPPHVNGVDGCSGIGLGAAPLALKIQQDGIGALSDIDGPFAGFLLDQRGDQCLLFNDRYGVERLFLHVQDSRVYFSSEAKAIVAVATSACALDPVGLAEWLACGCTIGERSFFRDVEILPGATAISFRARRPLARTRYFDRSSLEQLPQLSPDQFAQQFAASLASAATDAVTRSPDAAISLTGGLDSRLVIASLDAPPGTVPCYTFGSMYRLTMDARVASVVAARCGQPHQVLELDQTFLDDVSDYFRRAVYASDGYLGFAGSAELYLNQLARRIAPVRVTGNWGGELMRGVCAFKFRSPKGDFLHPQMREQMAAVAHSFEHVSVSHPVSYTLFHQMPHQGFGRYAIERSQVQMRSPFLAGNVVKALYQAPAATRSSMEVVLKVLASRPGLISVPTDTGRLGHSVRAVSVARQAYRRAMVKAEYMTSHGAPNWMAALSASVPLLETAFLGRDKFQHFRYWTRHELSGFVRGVLLNEPNELANWFDLSRIAMMVESHIAGRANYIDELDKLMTVAMFQRAIDSARSSAAPGAISYHELATEMSAFS